MGSLWLRWTWRDFRSRWVQICATALVLAVGVGGFAGLRSLAQWRIDSAEASYESLRAPDLRVDLAEGSYVARGELAGALAELPDGEVEAAQERLVVDSQLDASSTGKTVLVPARLVGTPGPLEDEPVEAVAVTSPAAGLPGGGADATVLDQGFGRFYDLPGSGRVRIAGLGEVAYQGLGVTPEHFLILDDAGVSGAEGGLALVYLPLAEAQRASGHAGTVNRLLVRSAPGTAPGELRESVRRALAVALPDEAVTITGVEDDPVRRVIIRDARNDQKTYTVFAILLLAGAALAAFNLVSRAVDAQRREIGIGMALGAEPRLLARRPLALGLQIGLLGAILGVPVGIGLAGLVKSLLRAAMPLPAYSSALPLDLYAEGALLALAIPLVAAALPVRRAVAVRPIEAIRSGHRSARGGGLGHLLRHARPPGGALTQLPLRNLMRAPRRSLLTLLGLGAVMTAVVAVLVMVDSIGEAADRAAADASRSSPDRLEVTLTGFVPEDGGAVRRIAAGPGIEQAEAGLTVGATARGGQEAVGLALSFVDPDSPIWHPVASAGTVSGRGLVLAEKAAEDLGVGVGDEVLLEHPERAGGETSTTTTRMRVTGLHDNPIRALAYVDRDWAAALGLGGVANQVVLVPDPGTPQAALQRELFGRPGIASVRPATDSAEALEETVESFGGAIQMVVLITLGLGLLVAFTSASVSVDEKRREYATMFAFGLPVRTGMRVAMTESLTTGLAGTIVGLGIGVAVAGWIVTGLLAETFPDLGFQPTLTPGSVLITVLVGVGAVALAPLFNWRRLRRMDIPSTLRVME